MYWILASQNKHASGGMPDILLFLIYILLLDWCLCCCMLIAFVLSKHAIWWAPNKKRVLRAPQFCSLAIDKRFIILYFDASSSITLHAMDTSVNFITDIWVIMASISGTMSLHYYGIINSMKSRLICRISPRFYLSRIGRRQWHLAAIIISW